ncbi:bifunctional alpha/beta hydrolase/OsmC family protein [Aurantimonas sp. E1-2-R+4]|uniref:bifunctional alpha/beta hydrolase/OsmC family protein n=1 Tax=Aurantimonas sp. E1-2-R+4 TaxID=3113714 RepID=UPI002F947DE4
MSDSILRVDFQGHSGDALSARLDMPLGPVRAYALFAHCFTCSKDLQAARTIANCLAGQGIAVLRFDFTGLGSSEGEFASTNFSSNVADLKSAADYLRANFAAPKIVIGHSLGGAAVLAVAGDIPEVRAVVTIAAPAEASHVEKQFAAHVDAIQAEGAVAVKLAGRPFTIRRQFLEDIRGTRLTDRIATMRKALMVMHSPVDEFVGIDNASAIFTAARHPKSFVSLDGADHLLTKRADAEFAAEVVAGWATRYIGPEKPQGETEIEHVGVRETLGGTFQNAVHAGRHRLMADEPESVGGLDSGPSPYDFLSAALASCTSMTLRMYADRKKLDLGRITVDVAHRKVHFKDCESCAEDERARDGKIDQFTRRIHIEGSVPDGLEAKILEIADKCPVHRTLKASSKVATTLVESDAATRDAADPIDRAEAFVKNGL